jgi:hypothetical protein
MAAVDSIVAEFSDILTCLLLDGTIDGEHGGRSLLLVVTVHAPMGWRAL